MATLPAQPGFVYRLGRASLANLVPRMGKDTIGGPGVSPGLSTVEDAVLGPHEKAQLIELSLLPPPLKALPDDPSQGGTPGHVAIAPVDASGAVDQQLVEEWAASRGQLPPHPFTRMVFDAIVRKDVKGKP